MSTKNHIPKIFIIFSFGLSLMFLKACGEKEERIKSKVEVQQEQVREAEIKQAQAQEQAKFKSLGECLKVKKAQAGVSKPTVEMIKQCTAERVQN